MVFSASLVFPFASSALNDSRAPTKPMSATLDHLIATRIRQDVQSMHAYAIQDSRGMVKLDAMENPHPLSAALKKELGERLAEVALNRYPGSRIEDLKQAL